MDWAAASTVIAALVAAYAANAAYRVSKGDSRRATQNSVLFNLLELWYLLKRSRMIQSTELTAAYLSVIKRKFPNIELSTKDFEKIDSIIAPVLSQLLPSFLVREQDSIAAAYKRSISDLATVDPILAFRMGGNEALMSTVDMLDRQIQMFLGEAAKERSGELTKSFLDNLGQRSVNYLYEDALSDLERDLRALARRISVPTWVRLELRLRKAESLKSSLPEIVEKLIDKLLMPTIAQLIASTKNKNANSPAEENRPPPLNEPEIQKA